MSQSQIKSTFLDTNFLINLVDRSKPQSKNTHDYFNFFIKKQIKIFVSTIVFSEYLSKKGADISLFLDVVHPIPFSFEHAVITGELMQNTWDKRPKGHRIAVKDDYKILAQCYEKNIESIATADTDFCSLHENLKSTNQYKPLLIIDINIPFSKSLLNPDTQDSFDFTPPALDHLIIQNDSPM